MEVIPGTNNQELDKREPDTGAQKVEEQKAPVPLRQRRHLRLLPPPIDLEEPSAA